MSWKKGRKLGPRSTAMFTYRQIKNAAWGFVSCSATKGFFSTRRALGSVPVLKKQQRRQQHQQNYMECKASVPHRDLLRGATSMSQELGGGALLMSGRPACWDHAQLLSQETKQQGSPGPLDLPRGFTLPTAPQ